MENIIDKLYDLHLTENSFSLGIPNKENTEKEWRLYNFLYENLPKQYTKMFLEYVDLRGSRQSEELRAAYEYGFKTAIRLIAESLQE